MDTELSLYNACVLNPGDNMAHLVYADFLEENHSDDDRLMARVEWIRLTCTKATNLTKRRQAGEPYWIQKNAHRLWPRIVNRIQEIHKKDLAWVINHRFIMGMGLIRWRMSVLGRRGSVDSSLVHIHCRRGIASRVLVTLLRAKQVAPIVARDEPMARICLTDLSTSSLGYSTPRHARVDKRAFTNKGLEEVYTGIEGHENEETTGKMFSFRFHKKPVETAHSAISSSLTRWARRQSGIPDYPPPIDRDEPTIPEEVLTVPPRV